MSTACPNTMLLAQRLAMVARLPASGAIIHLADARDLDVVHELIVQHRGVDVARATALTNAPPGHPFTAPVSQGRTVFLDPGMTEAPASAPISDGQPAIAPSTFYPFGPMAISPDPAAVERARLAAERDAAERLARAEARALAESHRMKARADRAARAVERTVARAALLAMLDAVPSSGAIIITASVSMAAYVGGLLRSRRPLADLNWIWILVGRTAAEERDHLAGQTLPVVRLPGVLLNRARAEGCRADQLEQAAAKRSADLAAIGRRVAAVLPPELIRHLATGDAA